MIEDGKGRREQDEEGEYEKIAWRAKIRTEKKND